MMKQRPASTNLEALDRKIEEFARTLEIANGVSSVDIAAIMVRGFHQKRTYRLEASLHCVSGPRKIRGIFRRGTYEGA